MEPETFPNGERWIVAHVADAQPWGRTLLYALPDGTHARIFIGNQADTEELRALHGEALAAGLVRVRGFETPRGPSS